jgi:hypothetical protein
MDNLFAIPLIIGGISLGLALCPVLDDLETQTQTENNLPNWMKESILDEKYEASITIDCEDIDRHHRTFISMYSETRPDKIKDLEYYAIQTKIWYDRSQELKC